MKAANSVTAPRQFRLPHDVYERLAQQGNMTTYVVEALREKFRRDDMKAARQAEAQ